MSKGKPQPTNSGRNQRDKSLTLPDLLRDFVRSSKLELHPHEVVLLGQAWDIQAKKGASASRLRRGHPILGSPIYREDLQMTHILTPTRYREAPPGSTTLMHASSLESAAGILVRGFKIPKRHGMFGRGVYFTDSPDKAYNYLGCDGGIIVKARVNLGRVHQAEKAMTCLSPNAVSEFDSVMGVKGETFSFGDNTLLHNEWCVYDQSRIFFDRVEVWKRSIR